jgi:hypothetical protein
MTRRCRGQHGDAVAYASPDVQVAYDSVTESGRRSRAPSLYSTIKRRICNPNSETSALFRQTNRTRTARGAAVDEATFNSSSFEGVFKVDVEQPQLPKMVMSARNGASLTYDINRERRD